MKRKAGFTLSEVLITLGIIGVVAALTIPTLMNNIQHKILEVRFKKSVAMLYLLIERATNELQLESFMYYCGPYYKFYESRSEECYNALDSVIATITPQKRAKNWSKESYTLVRSLDDIYTINGNKVHSINSCQGSLQYVHELKDGSYIGYLHGCGDTFNFSIDLNGPQKPNKLGYDIFVFELDNNGKFVGRGSNNTITDEEALSLYSPEIYETAGAPCNLTSQRKGNGLGCTSFALRNVCPWDNTKKYWECLP